MTGNEIFNIITSSDFYAKALDFSIEKVLVFTSEPEASEFLALYCTLLSEKQHGDFNEERLSSTYKKLNTVLLQNKQISSKDFLKNPQENVVYILRGTMCRILRII